MTTLAKSQARAWVAAMLIVGCGGAPVSALEEATPSVDAGQDANPSKNDAPTTREAPDAQATHDGASEANVVPPTAKDAATQQPPVDAWTCHPLTAAEYCTPSTCYSIPDGCGGLLDCASVPACTSSATSCGPAHEVCASGEMCVGDAGALGCLLVTYCVGDQMCQTAACPSGVHCIDNVCGGRAAPVHC